MGTVFLDFYEPDGTTLIGTLDDEQHLITCEVRPALWELGAGSFSVNRHTAAASAAMLQKGNIVKYRVPLIRSTAIWGFLLQDGDFDLVSRKEQGGEHLAFSGPGLIAILSNARLHHAIYAPGQDYRGDAPDVPDMWRWRNQSWGEILVRIIEEGQNNDDADFPLGMISISFDRDEDSAGVDWPAITGEFQTPIGSDVLTVADRLAVSGGLFLTFDAETMTLNAYQTYGSDLTGAFGAGTVRFEKGVNLLTELSRKSVTSRMTHVITKDKAGDYAIHEAPSWSGLPVTGYLEVGQTDDPALVADIAQQYMAASLETAEEYELEFTPGENAAAGLYLPGPGTSATPDNFWPGAMVTVHTGSGEHDLNEAELRLVALRYVLDKAASDASNATRALSLRIVAELSYRAIGPGFGTTHQDPGFCCGPPPPVPTVPPGSPTPGASIWSYFWDFETNNFDSTAAQEFMVTRINNPGALSGWWGDSGGGSNTGTVSKIACTAGNYITIEGSFAKRRLSTISTSWYRLEWFTGTGAVNPFATETIGIPASGTGPGVAAAVDAVHLIPVGAGAVRIKVDNNLTANDLTIAQVGAGTPGDPAIPGQGLPELIGTGPSHAYADHSHIWVSASAPTASEDEEAGYPAGTIWVVVDDVDVPSIIYEVWYQLPHDDGSVSWSTRQQPLIDTLETEETDTTLVLHPDGAGGVEWGTDATGGGGGGGTLQTGRVQDTATAVQTTTSTSYVDVTGLTVTLTTGARRCLVSFVGTVDSTATTGVVELDVAVDGTRMGGVAGILSIAQHGSASEALNGSFTVLTDVLTAGSHTIKLQFRSQTGATVRVYLGASGVRPVFSVVELGS
jgi:hypothetical protein